MVISMGVELALMPEVATRAVPFLGLPGSLAGTCAPDVPPPFGVKEGGVAGSACCLTSGACEAEAWRSDLGKLLGGTLLRSLLAFGGEGVGEVRGCKGALLCIVQKVRGVRYLPEWLQHFSW